MSAPLRILFETSFWVRVLTNQDPTEQNIHLALLTAIKKGQIIPCLSPLILWECQTILKATYHLSDAAATTFLQTILALPQLTILENPQTDRAFRWQNQTGWPLPRCLILNQLQLDMICCTYDGRLKTLPEIQCQTPAEIVTHFLGTNL